MTDPVSTWLACALSLSLDDLIAAADHLVLAPVIGDPADPRPWTTIEALVARSERFHGRGASLARRALPFVRPGVESRTETLLRLLIVRSGLPEPETNIDVVDQRGMFVGRADLLYPRWKLVVEYDGEQHRTSSSQYARDAERVEGFHRAGYQRIGVRKADLFAHPARTIQRITRGLHDAGWRARASTRH